MKQFKPLLPLGDTAIIDLVISTFQAVDIDIFVVTGHRHEELGSSVNQRDIKIIYNPDFEQGMLSSVQAGIKELGKKYQAFFIHPVDIPMVKTSTVKQLIKAGIKHPKEIIYPVYAGKRGHPPLIPINFIPGILEWKQEGGLKSFLDLHNEKARNVKVTDRFILVDIDTPEDYEELQRLFRENLHLRSLKPDSNVHPSS